MSSLTTKLILEVEVEGSDVLSPMKPSSFQNRVLYIAALALFCDYFLQGMSVPLMPNLLDPSFNQLMISLVFAAKPAVQFFADPFMGSYVDAHGPQKPLLFGALVILFSTLLYSIGVCMTSNLNIAYGIVIIASAIQGIGSAATMSSAMTLCAITHDDSIRGEAMSTIMIGVALGSLFGPFVGGIIGYVTYYWVPYLIVGCGVLINILAQILIIHRNKFLLNIFPLIRPIKYVDEEKKKELKKHRSFRHHNLDMDVFVENPTCFAMLDLSFMRLLKDPDILFLFCLSVLGNACVGLLDPLVPLYLIHEYNESLMLQGIIMGCAVLGYVSFTPVAGLVSDRIPKRYCLAIGLCTMGCGLALCLLSNISIGIVVFALFTIESGLSFLDTPTLPFLATIIENKPQIGGTLGMVYALNDMALSVGFTIGPIIGAGLEFAFGADDPSSFRYTAGCLSLLFFFTIPSVLLRLKGTAFIPVEKKDQTTVGEDVHSLFADIMLPQYCGTPKLEAKDEL